VHWWSGFREEFITSGMGRISLKVVPGSSRDEAIPAGVSCKKLGKIGGMRRRE
jgi:hypothetical protein